MADGAALVFDATDRLLGDLADSVPPLTAVAGALTVLAEGLGVEKVIVAVDDAALGRQVFCSRRAFLGDAGIGLCGPPGTWTEPTTRLDDTATRLLMRAVAVGIVHSAAPGRVEATAPVTTPLPAPEVPEVPDVPDAPPVPPTPDTAIARPIELSDVVADATAKSLRYGWGFTLVLLHGGPGLASALRPRMRAADTLVEVSDHELAILLPDTAGDRVPHVLTRIAANGDVPTFSYGLACCPADGGEATNLCRTAAARLDEARRAASGG